MKYLYYILIVFSTLTVCAQPGYMGKKNVISLMHNYGPGFVLPQDYIQSFTGIRYEFVTSTGKSWIFGIQSGGNQIYLDENSYNTVSNGLLNSTYVSSFSSLGEEGVFGAKGSLTYKVSELSVGRRSYLNSYASIAPYGLYFTWQAVMGKIKLKDRNINYYNGDKESIMSAFNEHNNPITMTAWSLAGGLGIQRIIADKFTINAETVLAVPIKRTNKPGPLFTEHIYSNVSDYEDMAILTSYTIGRVFRFNLSLGYMF